jgi:transposase
MRHPAGACALLAVVPAPATLIGDRAIDPDDFRRFLAEQGSVAVIPLAPLPFDAVAYRQRNLIGPAFCHLKDWRDIATRNDKLARNFLAGICLAASLISWPP